MMMEHDTEAKGKRRRKLCEKKLSYHPQSTFQPSGWSQEVVTFAV
jgi:hypothetical protein